MKSNNVKRDRSRLLEKTKKQFEVCLLYAEGLKISQISDKMGLDRKTVRKYLKECCIENGEDLQFCVNLPKKDSKNEKSSFQNSPVEKFNIPMNERFKDPDSIRHFFGSI